VRWASSANQAAAERDDIQGVFLLDLAFDSGHVRCNDSDAALEFGGNTYYGVGELGRFDGVEEAEDFVARGTRFELLGVDSGLISTIRNDVYQGRAATLYVGMLRDNSLQFVDTPEVAWSGFMDTMRIEKRGQVSRIILTCEHRLRSAPPFSRWSDADQKARSSGDRFFDLATLVAGFTSTWGGKGTTWGPKPGGGSGPQ
jgi:hypothetical protein